MGSLPDEVLLRDLELAFNSFYQCRRARLGFITSSRDFEQALKSLDGNFIKTGLIGKDQVVTFHNPSVSDFLEYYLAETPTDVADLIDGAYFYDQFLRLWRGQRGVRFGGVDIHKDKFIQTLEHRLSAPTCQIVLTKNRRGDIQGVQYWDKSFEARTKFAVEVADALRSAESQSVVERLLKALQDRMKSEHGDREDLVRLLRALSLNDKDSPTRASIFESAKAHLLTGLVDREDFVSLGRFVESFPTAIPIDELEGVRDTFVTFCKDYDISWADEPDDLRAVATDFETVAIQISADVDTICENLTERADEWESERAEDNPEHEDGDSDDEWRGQPQESDSEGQMFEGLLNELDEREQ